jgi:hypothetical protein
VRGVSYRGVPIHCNTSDLSWSLPIQPRGLLFIADKCIGDLEAARFHRTANRRSAVLFHPTVAPQSRSLKEVLGVIRFAVSTPVNDTVRCPEVSYPSSLKVPEYELPFGLN